MYPSDTVLRTGTVRDA